MLRFQFGLRYEKGQMNTCRSCRSPKATLACELCHDPLCKACDRFLDADTFSFLNEKPAELSHSHYCPACHQTQIEPALESYDETMERARNTFIFYTTQRKPAPVLRKSKEPVRVASCPDRDETILRLAFRAAEQGFNAVIETDLVSQKIRDAGYQKTAWSGTGIPAEIDETRLR